MVYVDFNFPTKNLGFFSMCYLSNTPVVVPNTMRKKMSNKAISCIGVLNGRVFCFFGFIVETYTKIEVFRLDTADAKYILARAWLAFVPEIHSTACKYKWFVIFSALLSCAAYRYGLFFTYSFDYDVDYVFTNYNIVRCLTITTPTTERQRQRQPYQESYQWRKNRRYQVSIVKPGNLQCSSLCIDRYTLYFFSFCKKKFTSKSNLKSILAMRFCVIAYIRETVIKFCVAIVCVYWRWKFVIYKTCVFFSGFIFVFDSYSSFVSKYHKYAHKNYVCYPLWATTTMRCWGFSKKFRIYKSLRARCCFEPFRN